MITLKDLPTPPFAAAAATGAAFLLAAGLSIAAGSHASAAQVLSDEEIAGILAADGYTLVAIDEREEDEIEVYADKDGKRYEIELSLTGEILDIDLEDDDQDDDS